MMHKSTWRVKDEIAGLDIGTTGCEISDFLMKKQKYLDHAYQDYPVKRSMSGHEIDMWVLRDAVLHVVSGWHLIIRIL